MVNNVKRRERGWSHAGGLTLIRGTAREKFSIATRYPKAFQEQFYPILASCLVLQLPHHLPTVYFELAVKVCSTVILDWALERERCVPEGPDRRPRGEPQTTDWWGRAGGFGDSGCRADGPRDTFPQIPQQAWEWAGRAFHRAWDGVLNASCGNEDPRSLVGLSHPLHTYFEGKFMFFVFPSP